MATTALIGGLFAPKFFYNKFKEFAPIQIYTSFNIFESKLIKAAKISSVNIFIGHSFGCLYAPYIDADVYFLICPVVNLKFPLKLFRFIIKDDIKEFKNFLFYKLHKIILGIPIYDSLLDYKFIKSFSWLDYFYMYHHWDMNTPIKEIRKIWQKYQKLN